MNSPKPLTALVLLAALSGCGLLDSKDEGPAEVAGEVAPPAAKVAQAPPIQRRTPTGTQKAVSATQAKTVAPTGDVAKNADDGDDSRNSDDEVPDADDKPTKKRAKADVDDDEGVADDKPDLGADLFVKRLVIAKNVKGREPVGAGNRFKQGAQERIYAFVEVGNRDQVPSEIYVSFYEKKTGKGQRVPLKIGKGSRWRTWVYTRTANKPGTWHAVVKNAKGKTLASQSFEITGKAKSDKPKDDAKKAKKSKDTAGKDKASKSGKAKSDKPKTDSKAKTQSKKKSSSKKNASEKGAAKKSASDKAGKPGKSGKATKADKKTKK